MNKDYNYIYDIKSPKFLKKKSNEELKVLASDIREFIIDNVSKTGGHLSSNLGVVELTIMIHKVFSSPKDKIIFDVGHQAYTHKILTGRSKNFSSLRKFNGLSGFQKMSESKFDSYEAGHSSTSLSAALGFTLARDKKKEKNKVIAVIGDASISNGLSYEALNQIGEINPNMIIILNDNNMSISENVGAIHNYLDKLRTSKGYGKTKNRTKKVLNKIPFIGKYLVKAFHYTKESIKKIYIREGYLFEEYGINYYGPINGHDLNELELYLNLAKNSKGPTLVHVITEKGKGYKYAENDKTGLWHGVGPFNKETGEIYGSKGLTSYSEIISDSLIRLMNEKIILITPAMEVGSKLTRFKEMFPKNFIDVGIAEEHALVLGNAMSIEGFIPFISIYSSFLQRGYDEVLHDIARMNSHVIIGIDRCGIVGEDGETHQGVFDLTFLLPIPNLIISSPKDSIEATNLIKTAIKTKSPFIIRYSKKKVEYKKEKPKLIKVGSWEKITGGEDLTIITYGDFVLESLEVVKKLKEENINVELVNARFIKPIDEEYFRKIEEKNKPIIVYEESMRVGSLGSYLSLISKQKITVLAIKDAFVKAGKREELLKYLELNSTSLYNTIKKEVDK